MGLLGPFVHTSKTKQKFWLHMKEKGKARLFYFSKDPAGALDSLPRGFEVVENPRTGLPFIKRKAGGGLLAGLFGKPKTEVKEEAQEKKEEAGPENE